MDLLTPRQKEILEIAQLQGRVMVDDLVGRFDVTPQTIRKDLNDLCLRNVLNRVHGGAVLAMGVTNFDYEARRLLAVDEKRRIGEVAAKLIPSHCTILINIGTTTEQVARHLLTHNGLMVITNNINVVNILNVKPDFEIIVSGGVVRHSDGGVVGEAAVDFIGQFKVDYAIIGASAIDPDGSLLDYDYREVRVSQAIIANARKTILVADAMKFERRAPVRIGHLSAIDMLVTEADPPAPIRQICQENGIEVFTLPDSHSTDDNSESEPHDQNGVTG